MHANTCQIGREGEQTAAEYLQTKGFHILDRNFRAPGGEIDIIGEQDHRIVFFEIKTVQKKRFDQFEYVMNRRKRCRIINTSKKYLYKNPRFQEYFVRYDLLCYDGKDTIYRHIENAFFEEGIG